jgi:hypothetical protein
LSSSIFTRFDMAIGMKINLELRFYRREKFPD